MPPQNDDDYHVPASWSNPQSDLYDDLIHGDPDIASDVKLQMYYDAALFELDIPPYEREAIYEKLEEYLWEEYGIELDSEFDWEGYRDWYDAQ